MALTIAVVGVVGLWADVRLPLGIGAGVPYAVMVLLTLRLRRPWVTAVVAVVANLLVLIGYAIGPPPRVGVGLVVLNHAMVTGIIWSIAATIILESRTYRALRGVERQRQDVLDISEAIVLVVDPAGGILEINRKGCELLGSPRAELLGRPWLDFVAAGDREAVRAALQEGRQGGTPRVPNFSEMGVISRGGHERVVAWHNAYLHDEGGTFAGIMSSGTDVTEERRAGQQLRQSRKQLEDVKLALDQAALVARTDRDGLILNVNDKFCAVSKYGRAELIGQDHRILNSGTHPKSFMAELWNTIEHGQVWRGEILNRAKDGSLYWVDATIVPSLNDDGAIYQYLTIQYDISERKRAEAQLREQTALARVGAMAAVVAHEVRNPLAGMTGALQVLRRRMDDQSPEYNVLGEILDRVGVLNETLEDLLLYARPRKPRFEVVTLDGLVDSVLMGLAADPRFANVAITAQVPPLQIAADGELLRGALFNLLLNAAQALDGQGSVRVSARDVGGWCELDVTDDGPGMRADVLARVFEPFFTTRSRGSGLGLAVVKRTAELHGGHVFVECPDGGGTRFRLTLPVQQQAVRQGTGGTAQTVGAGASAAPAPALDGAIAAHERAAVSTATAELDLRTTLEMATAFLAHELENPLAGILTSLQNLNRGIVAPERQPAYFEMMRDALLRMQAQIERSVKALRGEPPPAAVQDLARAVASSCRHLEESLSRRRLTVRVEIAPEQKCVQAGGMRLEHAVGSMLRHAIRSAREGCCIHVDSVPDEGRVGLRLRYLVNGDDASLRASWHAVHPRVAEVGLLPAIAERILRPDGATVIVEGGDSSTSATLWLKAADAASREAACRTPKGLDPTVDRDDVRRAVS